MTAVSVVSCLSKRGYYLQQRVYPLTPVISHPEVRLSTSVMLCYDATDLVLEVQFHSLLIDGAACRLPC